MGIAAVATVAATLVSTVGTFVQASAVAQAANYQAEVAKANAEIARQNSSRAIQRSQVEARDQDALTAALLGEQVAAQGASGFDLGSGSAGLARKSAAELGRRDTLNVRQAGEVESHNYLVEAMNQEATATLKKMEAKNSLIGGFFGAAGGLLSGIGGIDLGSGSTLIGASSSVSPKAKNLI